MSKFLSYILNLRGVAIFIVVGVHARGNIYEWESHPAVFDLLATFFDAREGMGTTIFIFIGGFLYQYITHNNWNFRKYIEKNGACSASASRDAQAEWSFHATQTKGREVEKLPRSTAISTSNARF